MIVWKSLLAQLIVFGVRLTPDVELIRLFSYENDLHSRVKLGINKSLRFIYWRLFIHCSVFKGHRVAVATTCLSYQTPRSLSSTLLKENSKESAVVLAGI